MVNHFKQNSLQLSSSAFKDSEEIPRQYTCSGQNINPPLNFLNIPENAKSLALIMHDPDAISADFVHWLVWDISPAIKAIAANSVPRGAIQGLNSVGDNSYIGPCPPKGSGIHRYKFELYALNSTLNLKNKTSREKLEETLRDRVLDSSELTGLAEANY